MAQLALHLLGSPSITLGDTPVALEQRKALALLAYLALNARPQRREALADLLWPEHPPVKALANLRQTLWLLRSVGLDGWLTLDRHTAALRDGYWLDVTAFEAALANGQAEQALALYRDDLIAELDLPDVPQLAAWLAGERARLRQAALAALPPLIAQCRADGAFTQAMAHARRWAALDPQSEPARRQLAEIALRATAPAPAVTVRALDKEARTSADEHKFEPLARRAPPEPTSTFVGRAHELVELRELLSRPGCRLVTIVGPGGIGKTRLALEFAARSRDDFPDGATFVALEGVDAARHIPAAIAEALDVLLHGQADAWTQIADALRTGPRLLILDNFEHLIDAAGSLIALLEAAPRLHLLVTSREALRLREEWLSPLDGLELPANPEDQDAATASAVRLFIERAQQVRRHAALDVESVARICDLVGGMPLAIELAATWTMTLTCAEIADEIARNLAFLETNLRNVPERHRSIQAVFDQTWARLTDAERRVLARLAIFRGGFTREAAEAVAGATLPILARLADQALLRHTADNRYRFHELLRQYAEQRLRESAADAAQAAAASGRYLARFLNVQFERATSGRQRAAIAAVAAERDNIRNAWPDIVAQTSGEELRRAAHIVAVFYFFCGPDEERRDALEFAVERVRAAGAAPEPRFVLANLLNELAYSGIRTGRIAEAGALLAESAALFAETGAAPPPGVATDPEIALGVIALIRGDYAEASRLAEQVRIRSETHGYIGNLHYAWYLRTEAALAQGLTTAAHHAAEQALVAARQAGDEWYEGYSHNQLGQLAAALGQYDEAEQHFRASYAIREAFGDRQGMALALLNQGHVARRRGAFAEAAELFEGSRALYARIGDRGGIASALDGLGTVACASGNYDLARQHFRQALELTTTIAYQQMILQSIAHIGELLFAVGQPELAAEALTVLLRHPASSRDVSELAQQLLVQCEADLPPAASSAAVARGQRTALDALVEQLLVWLARPFPSIATQPAMADAGATRETAATASAPPGVAQRLAGPLSERELAILAAIAEGLSNQEIADRLILSLGTIKWYTGQIYGKLGVQTRTQAVAQARKLNLLA